MNKIEEKKELKTKNNKEFCIYTIEGVDYSCWDKKINEQLNKGDTIDSFKFEQKGKYKNLSGMTGHIPMGDTTPEKEISPNKVDEFKSKEADKFELGMAKNNAATVLSGCVGNKDSDTVLKDYWELVGKLYESGKQIRKEKLGY